MPEEEARRQPIRFLAATSMQEDQGKCFMCSKYLYGNSAFKLILINITMVFLRIDEEAESWLASWLKANRSMTKGKIGWLKMVLKQMLFLGGSTDTISLRCIHR